MSHPSKKTRAAMKRDDDITPDSSVSFSDDFALAPHRLKPHDLELGEWWCYLERSGIQVVVDAKELGVQAVLVPIALLEAWHRRRSRSKE